MPARNCIITYKMKESNRHRYSCIIVYLCYRCLSGAIRVSFNWVPKFTYTLDSTVFGAQNPEIHANSELGLSKTSEHACNFVAAVSGCRCCARCMNL